MNKQNVADPSPERTISLVIKSQNEASMNIAKLERILIEAGTQKIKETRAKLSARG